VVATFIICYAVFLLFRWPPCRVPRPAGNSSITGPQTGLCGAGPRELLRAAFPSSRHDNLRRHGRTWRDRGRWGWSSRTHAAAHGSGRVYQMHYVVDVTGLLLPVPIAFAMSAKTDSSRSDC
jgi:hypothetical protein